MMPKQYVQQMLTYEDHEEAIGVLGQAIDALGGKDIAGALDVLMSYREHLITAQTPVLKQYDPREERRGR